MRSSSSVPSIARALGRLARALYPARSVPDRLEIGAFIDDALEDAWRTRRWRGLVAVGGALTLDLARAWAGRPAPPITNHVPTDDLSGRRTLMDRWLRDLRDGFRSLRHAPAFTAVAVLTLALGIGATTAVYAVVDGAILRPFPYPDMDRLVVLGEVAPNGSPMSVSWPNFVDWEAQNEVLDELGLYRAASVSLLSDDAPDRLSGHLVSSAVFTSIGIQPLSGRVFGKADDAPGAERVAIISERLWRGRFAGRADIVGHRVTLNDEPFAIVGVMPAAMRFPSRLTDVWLPLGLFVQTFPKDRGAHPGLAAVGRLKGGVTIDTARAGMDAIAQRLGEQYPDSNRGTRITVTSYYELIVREIRPALYMILGAVGLLLLMACSNLASLMLARAETRHRECAVRAALGATRGQLVRQFLVESCLLAGAGGLAGVGLAYAAVRTFVASRPSAIPRVDLIGIDWRVLLFATVASALTVLLFALLPALRASTPNLQGTLRNAGAGGIRRSIGLRRLLVAGQVAFAAVLLIGAGLLVKSLVRLMQVDLGFSPERVVTMRVSLPDASYPSADAWTAFHERLLARLAETPGLETAGMNTAVPLAGGGAESPVIKEGDPPPSHEHRPMISLFQATGGRYFETLGIAVIRGRPFDERDRAGAPLVGVIDERGAAKLFGEANPIGKRIAFEFSGGHGAPQPIWREVVGVVRTVRHYSLLADVAAVQVYAPFTQIPYWFRDRRPGMALVARTSGDPEVLISGVRQAVAAIDGRLPVHTIQPMSQYVAQQTEQPRLNATLLTGFAVVALLLAATGVYGVLSYVVSQRTREIGVRLALGARRVDILREVAGQGLIVALAGLVLGLVVAAVAARAIRAVLVSVSPSDATTFVAVGVLLIAVGALASLIPARRASGIDPLVALRSE
jgi:putative ABC transport system permease protein